MPVGGRADWVVGNEGQHVRIPQQLELDQFCRQRLTSFKCPKRYVFHTEMPTGVTGKLDRVALGVMAMSRMTAHA
jgi:acyl-CoA synthetase (AMP-forming)/AMP-acid ligase II